MNNDPAFWRGLRDRFKAQRPDERYRVDYKWSDIQAVLGVGPEGGHCFISECEDDHLAEEQISDYKSLAVEAADAAGCPDVGRALDWWIDRLSDGEGPLLRLKRLAFYQPNTAHAWPGKRPHVNEVGIRHQAWQRLA